METKKPTLEEVKEYFKNAKEVKCLANDKIRKINDVVENLDESREWNYGNYWLGNKKYNVLVYSDGKYAEIISYKKEIDFIDGKEIELPKHYDNSKGSIYQFCENQNLNSWEFDIIKRTVRCRKKGNFKEDLEKTKHLIDLYLKEYELHN